MRSHFLSDFPRAANGEILTVLPNFDFHHLDEVTELCWNSSTGILAEHRADIKIKALYENGDVRVTVAIHCLDVKQLLLPRIGPSMPLFEVELEDISNDQLEGIRYKLIDYGPHSLEILCNDIRIRIDASDLR